MGKRTTPRLPRLKVVNPRRAAEGQQKVGREATVAGININRHSTIDGQKMLWMKMMKMRTKMKEEDVIAPIVSSGCMSPDEFDSTYSYLFGNKRVEVFFRVTYNSPYVHLGLASNSRNEFYSSKVLMIR